MWVSTILTVKYKAKKRLQLLKIETSSHKSKEAALGHVYNLTEMSYCRDLNKTQTVISTFQWGWVPSYMRFAIVSRQKNANVYFNFTDQHSRRRFSDFLDKLIKINQEREFGKQETYPDKSIKMSRWAWQETIPKGYQLLKQGEIILESDREWYSNVGFPKHHWSDSPSWYNVGKVVGESSGISFVGEDGKEYDREPTHPDPLVIRKLVK
jgi:hypothetical protein